MNTPTCDWCAGSGFVPDEIGSGVEGCPSCLQTGMGEVRIVLPSTRSHKFRAVVFDPARSRMVVTRGRKETAYRVEELPTAAGFDGRGFAVTREDGGGVYHTFVARNGQDNACTCAGSSYEASARANRRAYFEGRPHCQTEGCCHLDSALALLHAGWLDAEVPAELVGHVDPVRCPFETGGDDVTE